MIEDDITEGKYIETSDKILCNLKRFQYFLYRHLYKHKDYEQCVHVLISLPVFSLQLRLISLNSLQTFLQKVSSYVLQLIKQGLVFTMLRESSQNTSVRCGWGPECFWIVWVFIISVNLHYIYLIQKINKLPTTHKYSNEI